MIRAQIMDIGARIIKNRSGVTLFLIFDVLEGLAELRLDLVTQLGIVFEELLDSLAALG